MNNISRPFDLANMQDFENAIAFLEYSFRETANNNKINSKLIIQAVKKVFSFLLPIIRVEQLTPHTWQSFYCIAKSNLAAFASVISILHKPDNWCVTDTKCFKLLLEKIIRVII